MLRPPHARLPVLALPFASKSGAPVVLALALAFVAARGGAAATFVETFDAVGGVTAGDDGPASLVANGWIFRNQSEPLGTGTWQDGITAWWPPENGAGYIAVQSDSTGFDGAVSQWAILPPIAGQAAGDALELFVSALSSSQADALELRYSPSGGASTGVSATDVGDFTTLLLDVNPVPVGGWVKQAVSLPGSGRVAVRFHVPFAVAFGFESYVGIDSLTVNTTIPHACNIPPMPGPGQTVTWTLANSPYGMCSSRLVPATGSVVVEAGVVVLFDAVNSLTVAGALTGTGTPGARIGLTAPANVPAPLRVTGTLDLRFADIGCHVRPDSGGSVLLTDCAIGGNGGLFSDGGPGMVAYAPPYVEVRRCTFTGSPLDVTGCTLVARDTSLAGTYLRTLYSYLLLDRVDMTGSPFFGMNIAHDDQPLFLDDITITGSAGPAFDLTGANRGNSFYLGAGNRIQGNLYPVQLADGGLLAGSVLPASGNANDVVRWVRMMDVRGPIVWAPVGVPYVVESDFPTVVGSMTILPGVTVKLGSGAGIVADVGSIRARGTPSAPIRFTRLDAARAWNGLAFGDAGSKLEHCIVEGSTNGVSCAGTVLHAESCLVQDNGSGLRVNGLGAFKVHGTQVLGNDVGAVADPSILAGGGLYFNGGTNPNAFEGNATAVLARSDQDVDARLNWWGDASGPFAPSNPSGAGDAVTDGVSVLPFRTASPDFGDAPPLVTLQAPFFLLEAGSRVLLRWDAEDDSALVSQRIVFSPAGDFDLPLVVATGLPPDQRTFEWTVPDIGFQVTGEPAYVRVVGTDTAGQEGWDEAAVVIPSNEVAGTATLTSPTARSFTPGEHVDVCYETRDTDMGFASMDAYLFLDGDQRVVSVGGLATTSGCLSVGFEMPYVSTDTARFGLRMSGGCCNRVEWTFGDCFAIRPDPRIGDEPPAVTLLSPASGQTLAAGSVIPVAWMASDDESLRSFDVHASYDDGRTWHVVVADLPGTARSFDWLLPDGAEMAARIRVVARDLRFQNTSNCGGTPFVIGGPCVAGPPPSLVPSLRVTRGELTWTGDPDASGHDVVRGDLDALFVSDGDFSIATTECLANDLPATATPWADTSGANLWFLVRGVDCAAPSTFDSSSPVLWRSRDPGIAGAFGRCP